MHTQTHTNTLDRKDVHSMVEKETEPSFVELLDNSAARVALW
jgi:hypothetical protein